LSLANAILAIALAAALQAEEPRQLNGTQAQKVMTLVRGTSPYLVTGTYDVPPESELIIEAGTKLLFAKDAAVNVRGTLLIKGSESAPVELTGKATGGPTWQGLRINKSPSTQRKRRSHTFQLPGKGTGGLRFTPEPSAKSLMPSHDQEN
jgi:hypothetical protein